MTQGGVIPAQATVTGQSPDQVAGVGCATTLFSVLNTPNRSLVTMCPGNVTPSPFSNLTHHFVGHHDHDLQFHAFPGHSVSFVNHSGWSRDQI